MQGEQAQDVALVVAQAHCDAAAAAMQELGGPGGMQACQHMQAALGVLQDHSTSPELQRDIEAAIGVRFAAVNLSSFS